MVRLLLRPNIFAMKAYRDTWGRSRLIPAMERIEGNLNLTEVQRATDADGDGQQRQKNGEPDGCWWAPARLAGRPFHRAALSPGPRSSASHGRHSMTLT